MNGWRWKNQLIYEVLQSIYLVDDRHVSHLFANLSRPKRGNTPIPVHDLLSSPNGKTHFLSWLSYDILKI